MNDEPPRPDPAMIDTVLDYLRRAFEGVEHRPISGAEAFEVRRRRRRYHLHLARGFFEKMHVAPMVAAWLRTHDVARTLDLGRSGDVWLILDPDQPGEHPAESRRTTAQRQCPECQGRDIAVDESTALDPLPELDPGAHYCECKSCGTRFIYRTR